MTDVGFVYDISRDEAITLTLIKQIITDVLVTNHLNDSEESIEERWYGVALGDDEESTVALVYGKGAAQTLLSLYREAIQEDEEYGVEA
jgi:hypothetical protein